MRIVIHNHLPRPTRDYMSERGYMGRLIAPNGAVVEESDLFIRPERAAAWVRERSEELIKMGKRVVGKVVPGFADRSR